MKNTLILLTLAVFLNGCRYINTQEQYVNAKDSEVLKIPQGVDQPNQSSTLEIPSVNESLISGSELITTPPEMPAIVKRSEDEKFRLESVDGESVLIAEIDKQSFWEIMSDLSLKDWSTVSSNEENCEVLLEFNDSIAIEKENAGFFKKMLNREKNIENNSGQYMLSCDEKNGITTAKFTKNDGSKARTYLSDEIMLYLFEKLK